MSNNNVLKELLATGIHFAGPQGYWRKLGLTQDPGLASLEFSEFFEPVWRPGHKKSFLDGEGKMAVGMHGRSKDMLKLYNGLVTTTRIIGAAFFMYSVGVVNWHLHACRISRTYGCAPDLSSILEAATVPQKEKDGIEIRSMALSVCAFTLYEGSGALGGYSAQPWELWARLYGEPTPLEMKGYKVSREEAVECFGKYEAAEDAEKRTLFSSWLRLGYPDLPEGVDRILWSYYNWTQLYKGFEGGWEEPEKENPNHLGALIAGFSRRAAKGYVLNQSMDLLRALGPEAGPKDPVPLCQWIDQYKEEVETLLTDWGGISPFGQWLLSQVEYHFDRIALLYDIADRAQVASANPEAARGYAKQGLAYKLSKGGKTRFRRMR